MRRYLTGQLRIVTALIVASGLWGSYAAHAQNFEDAATIVYDASIARSEWVYDSKPFKRIGGEIVMQEGVHFASYSNDPEGFPGTKYTYLEGYEGLTVDEASCTFQVVSHIDTKSPKFEQNLKQFTSGFKGVVLPANIITDIVNDYSKIIFHLNNVIHSEIQITPTMKEDIFHFSKLAYKVSLIGQQDLSCREWKKSSIEVSRTNSGGFNYKVWENTSAGQSNLCRKQIDLSVPEQKIDRFKNVLNYIYSQPCSGSKRSGF